MKIPIDFLPPHASPGETPKSRCAVAEIRYKEIDPTLENGYLVYIKPVVLAGDDSDVTAYKAANPVFPHESTGNQWFNESQTESYRMLGVRSVLDTFKKPWNPQQKFEGVIRAASDQRPGAMAATAQSSQAVRIMKRRLPPSPGIPPRPRSSPERRVLARVYPGSSQIGVHLRGYASIGVGLGNIPARQFRRRRSPPLPLPLCSSHYVPCRPNLSQIGVGLAFGVVFSGRRT